MFFVFFFQAEDGIRDSDMWLEFRRVLFRSDYLSAAQPAVASLLKGKINTEQDEI